MSDHTPLVKKFFDGISNQGLITTLSQTKSYISRKRGELYKKLNVYKLYFYYDTRSIPEYNNTYKIDPDRIQYVLWDEDIKKHFDGTVPKNTIIWPGGWDYEKKHFNETFVYKSFVNRFKHGVSWESTEYFKLLTDDEEFWRKRKGRFKSVETPLEYLNKYECIYHDIKTNGYRSDSYISTYIGRNGEYIRADGTHRLSIAKILELESVPIKIRSRHEIWQKKRSEFVKEVKSNNHKEVSHSDLLNLK